MKSEGEKESASQQERDGNMETAKMCVKVAVALLKFPRVRARVQWKKLVGYLQGENGFAGLFAEMKEVKGEESGGNIG